LKHLCRASGVAALLRADAIPTAVGYDATCQALQIDGVAMSLTGGEDYELLFTAPQSPEADSIGTPIGEIVAGTGVRVLDSAGQEIAIGRNGFRHFS
jgi:thiamine-monophosphate kinase